MKKIVFLLLCCGFLFFSAGCEKEIKLDLPEEGRLVLLSNFSPDSSFNISLSTTIPINNTPGQTADYPSNATIQLFENGVYLNDFVYHVNNNVILPSYRLDIKPIEGNTYKVIANLPSYPTAEATNSIPPMVQIESFVLSDLDVEEEEPMTGRFRYDLEVKMKVALDAGNEQFFHVKAWQKVLAFSLSNGDTIISRSLREVDVFPTDNNITDLRIEHERGILLEQSSFLAHPEGVGFYIPFSVNKNTELEGPIFIELRHVSREYYLFHKSVGEQELSGNNQNVLSTEAYFIYNNIEGGIGNFSGYQATLDSLYY